MTKPLMAFDAGVAQRCILVAPEREDGLIHLLGIEHLQPHQQVEIVHRQPSDGQEQVRFEFGNDILKGILPEVRQVHERRNARRKLYQFLLHKLALGLVLLFLLGQFLFLLGGQVLGLGLVLELLNLLALVDDRLDDVVAQRSPALDPLNRRHCLRVV